MAEAADRTQPDVVFVGGAPAVGKTSVARPLAARLDMDLTHVDDFQIVLERVTDPDQYQPIHEWRLHPERVLALDDEGMIEDMRSVAAIVADAIAPVIADRLDHATRSVFEGDFIQPSFAASTDFDGVPADGRVRSVFLFDALEGIADNIAAHERVGQPGRAQISWNYSEWLRAECDAFGVPAIPAPPWQTVVARALSAITIDR